MNPKIGSIAKQIRDAKEKLGRRCVLMLGAGASLSSGVRPTEEIMQELLSNRPDLTEGTLQDRFDKLWEDSDQNRRELYLKEYLMLPPSPGYHYLAALIAQGYFKVVITFNFDQLLETALRLAPLEENDDFLVVIRGECKTDQVVCHIMETGGPQVKILKMHGGLKGGPTFLFNRAEMHSYPKEIEALLKELTRGDVLICGYAFQDDCVRNAFSPEGGSVYWVNPGEPPVSLKAIMDNRHSSAWIVGADDGKFDTFFEFLHEELKPSRESIPAWSAQPKANPFKFLASHGVADKEYFRGREEEARKVMERLNAPPPRGVIHLVGPAKAGKTSFVLAGVIANLDPAKFLPLYLRCHGGPPEIWLPQAIVKAAKASLPQNLANAAEAFLLLAIDKAKQSKAVDDKEYVKAAIKALGELLDGKTIKFATNTSGEAALQIVLVLDQFERVAQHFRDSREEDQFVTCLKQLAECMCDNVSLICVEVDDISFWKALAKANQDATTKHHDIEVRDLTPEKVAEIVETLAKQADLGFDPDVVQEITRRYREYSKASPPFSLAHVQAVCNILARSSRRDLASCKRVMQENREALDLALKIYETLSFIEDIPDELRPTLFRNVSKQVPQTDDVLQVLAENARRLFYEVSNPQGFAERQESGHPQEPVIV